MPRYSLRSSKPGIIIALLATLISALIITANNVWYVLIIDSMIILLLTILQLGRSSLFLTLFVCWFSVGAFIVSLKQLLDIGQDSWRATVMSNLPIGHEVSLVLFGVSLIYYVLPLTRPTPLSRGDNMPAVVPIVSLVVAALTILIAGSRDNVAGPGTLATVGFVGLCTAVLCLHAGPQKVLSRTTCALIGVVGIGSLAFGFRYVAWYLAVVVGVSLLDRSQKQARLFFAGFFVLYTLAGAITASYRQLGWPGINVRDTIRYLGVHEEGGYWQLYYFLHYAQASTVHILDMIVSIAPGSGSRNSSAVLLEALPDAASYASNLNIGAMFFAEGAKIAYTPGVVAYLVLFLTVIITKRMIRLRLLLYTERFTGLLALSWAYYGFTNSTKNTIIVYVFSIVLVVFFDKWRSARYGVTAPTNPERVFRA